MGLFLSKYLLIGTAAIAALGAFTGWRWLEAREALAVERSQREIERSQFENTLEQIQHNEQLAREASREYQVRLSVLQSESAALRESNRGLQITARRRIPAVSIAVTRLADGTPEPEGVREYELSPEWLLNFAAACQADATQLEALIGWVHAQSGQANAQAGSPAD